MIESDRDKLRRDDHDMLIEMRACLNGLVREQRRQGAQITDLYDKVQPIGQWVGTANSGFKALSYLGLIVIVVSLLWNGVASGIRAVVNVVAHEAETGTRKSHSSNLPDDVQRLLNQ